MLHQHRLKRLASEMSDINRDLLRLYGDKDGLMKEEVESMRGTEMFENFYNKLTSTKEYYQKFPSTLIDLNEEITCDVEIPFSGEEVFGKYLDLNNIFAVFLNIMKDILKEQDYLQYLDRFNSFFYIPIKVKSTKQYLDYLEQLWKYLKDFFDRTSPLVNLDSIINNEWKKDFESSYVPDQQAIENKITSNVNAAPQPLRLGMFADPSELEALGMNRLKEALEAIGLKCGGTLQDRAQRLWSIRGKKPEDYPANLRAKPVNKKRKTESDDLGHHKNVSELFVHYLRSSDMMLLICCTGCLVRVQDCSYL